jgi:predicted transcriptional regulator
MADKRAVLVHLNEAEWKALERLAEKKDLSKVAILRQALRLYELVDARISDGEKLVFEDKESKKELLFL